MKTKYFVISLPRSGTSSICKMANICGLNFSHAPHIYFQRRINEDIDLFADTPIYCPDTIEEIINNKNIDSRFIYIDRNFKDIFNSWVNVGLYRNYISMYNSNFQNLKKTMQYDLESYNKAFGDVKLEESNCEDIFHRHREKVLSIVNSYNKKILIYNFDKGWDDFCNFIERDIPNVTIPQLNKNKMFDKI
jgi:hypothetical protein